MATAIDKEQAKWMAESDARTLASAAAIQQDPKRLGAAAKAARKMESDMKREAKDAAARANAISNVAKKASGKAPAKKAAPSKPRAAKSSGRKR